MKRPICIGCGCDEQHACAMDHVGFYAGCWWLRFEAETRVGICSACDDLVSRWDDGERAPQLGLIADRFYRQAMFLYEDKASALAWVAAPQLLLGDRSARELILAGELERVQAVLDQIRDGAYI